MKNLILQAPLPLEVRKLPQIRKRKERRYYKQKKLCRIIIYKIIKDSLNNLKNQVEIFAPAPVKSRQLWGGLLYKRLAVNYAREKTEKGVASRAGRYIGIGADTSNPYRYRLKIQVSPSPGSERCERERGVTRKEWIERKRTNFLLFFFSMASSCSSCLEQPLSYHSLNCHFFTSLIKIISPSFVTKII